MSKARRVLLVEDSDFFRQSGDADRWARPAIASPRSPSAAEALRLREAGATFDADRVAISTMPGMDGFDFARAFAPAGRWRDLPLIALIGTRRAGRYRARPRGRLHRLRGEIRPRGADRQPAAMPGGTDRGLSRHEPPMQ